MSEARISLYQERRAQNHWNVNLGETWEIVFWTRELGCSEMELARPWTPRARGLGRCGAPRESPTNLITPVNFDSTNPAFCALRGSPQEPEIRELAHEFPMLTRTEISDVIVRFGPMRSAVEAELLRLSGRKR